MTEVLDTNPQTWPDDTIILRGGIGDAKDLARKADANTGGWSVQAQPSVDVVELARFVPNNRFRRTTVGRLREAGGYLVISPGPGYHRSLQGVSPSVLDEILGQPELNPVPPAERWPNT